MLSTLGNDRKPKNAIGQLINGKDIERGITAGYE